MALITASLPLIVVVTDRPRLPLAQHRIFGIFDLSDVSGRDFAILRRGKGSKGSGRDHPLASMQMSARFTFSN